MRGGYGGRMELRHLRYFVAVAEELNFTHAAARLRVAQPALSRQIKDLEEELQTPLFERGRAGVQLTRAGKVFYQRARAILAQAAEAANEARTAAGAITGSLVLGFPSGLHLNYLAPVIQAFSESTPKCSLTTSTACRAQQLKACARAGWTWPSWACRSRLMGSNTRLPGGCHSRSSCPSAIRWPEGPVLELADLRSEDFVFCTRESRPEFYDEFFRLCANAGFRPRVVKEVGGYPDQHAGPHLGGAGRKRPAPLREDRTHQGHRLAHA